MTAYNFSRLFKEAVERNDTSFSAVAAALGVSKQNVREFATGTRLPRLETAAKIADALHEPAILAAVRDARTRACRNCRADMLVNTTSRYFCGEECRILYRAKTNKPLDRRSLTVIGSSLDVHRGAVEAFCRSCEPDGVCRDAGCELRPVSPFPCLIQVVKPAKPRRRRWSEARKQAMSQKMKARWAARKSA